MKKTTLIILIALSLFACRKTSPTSIPENALEVTESNMAVIAKRTATWCSACGSYGFEKFDRMKDQYGDRAAYMAWKTSFVSQEGSRLFDAVGPQFNLGNTVPTFFYNFNVDAVDSAIMAHINQDYVIANSNYDMEINGDNIKLRTTTKFFTEVQGQYYIAPYLIVDNIVGMQTGHADGVNTVHSKYVAGIATPIATGITKDFGYQITANGASRGAVMNLDFEIERDVTWKRRDISFALIIFKKESWGLQFVNAFTK